MVMKRSKYQQSSPNNLGLKVGQLEKTREKLMEAILEYKNQLQSKILIQNMSSQEKGKMTITLDAINDLGQQLNTQNQAEGSLVLAITSLNAILMMHNEINELKYEIYLLNDKLSEKQNVAATNSVEPSE